MEHNPETRAGCYPSNGQRRMSLEAITLNLRRSSSNDYTNYDSGDTEVLGCGSTIEEEPSHPEMIDADVGDDAGFAAIELLRPPSASMDDPNAQSEDASSTDEGGDHDLGQPSSSRRGSSNGTDLTFMSLEDLLFELQREVGDSVSQSESDRRHHQSTGSPVQNSRNFVWTEHARNLLESAIVKLRSGKQSETNGRYAENPEYLDTLNKILLPLWPQGWMSPGELGQMIRYLSAGDRFEEEQDEHHDHDDIGDQYDDGLAHVLHDQQGSDAAYSSGGESPVAAGSSSGITTNRLQSQGNNGSVGHLVGGSAMCFICDRSFQSPHLLKIHVSHMHTPKALVCPQCHSRHSTLNGLRFHFSTKHKGLSQRFLNELTPPMPAGKMISVPATNANSTSATATAYIESRPIASLDSSTTTVSSKANSAIRNQLPHRSTTFSESQNGSSPSAGHESGDVECSSCKNKFATVGALKAHISMMHTEKNIRCRFCPNMYATQRAMLQHTYLKHHKERNCQCPHCGETFRTSGLANLHRRYGCNVTTASSSPSIKSTSTQGQDMRIDMEKVSTIRRVEGVNSGPLTVTMGSAIRGIRGNGKYHCRDCGASFPMPSAVWAHRKKEHTESTSLKKRGPFSLTDPKRVVGGQIFGQDLMRLSKEAANGKKKMRVKCSVCSAIFSNGYACYLHKKKIHGEDSIRRELNLSERSSTTTAASTGLGTTSSLKAATPASSTDIMPGLPMPNHASMSENLSTQLAASGILGQARMSTSSSSSRDSSPFYRGGDTYLAEGIVRKRYEFHCQCGMTFYNGFAFSRHRQRTGCSDGVRGVVVKESVCGVCSEVFPSTELLNEHFTSAHGGTILSSTQTSTLAAVIPKFSSPSAATSMSTSALGETEEGVSNKQGDATNSGKTISGHDAGSGGSVSLLDYRSHSGSSHASTRPPQQRVGATATAYVTTTALKRCSATPPSTSATTRQEKAANPLVVSASAGLGPSEIGAMMPPSISMERFPMRCLFCPFETVSAEALEEHRRRHEKSNNMLTTGQSSRTCPYCTYVTDNITNYVRHAAMHFSSRGGSGLGIKRVENPGRLEANKKRRLACTYCGRRFFSTSELMEHEFMHGTGK